jgi:hypothetical protein
MQASSSELRAADLLHNILQGAIDFGVVLRITRLRDVRQRVGAALAGYVLSLIC